MSRSDLSCVIALALAAAPLASAAQTSAPRAQTVPAPPPRQEGDVIPPLTPESVDAAVRDIDQIPPLTPESVDPAVRDSEQIPPLTPDSVDPAVRDMEQIPPLTADSVDPAIRDIDLITRLTPLSAEERAQIDAMLQAMGLTMTDEDLRHHLRDAQERLAQKAGRPRNRNTPPRDRVIPRDLDFTQYLQVKEEQERQERKPVMIRRVRTDPCGDFEVSWGGRKTCHAREIVYYELGYEDEAPPPEPEQDRDALESELFGTGGSDASGPGSGSSAPAGHQGGASAGGRMPAPSSGGTPPAAPGGGGRPDGSDAGSGSVVQPVNTPPTVAMGQFQPVGTFDARLDSVRLDTQDRLDVRVTLRARAGGGGLVANGDWIAVGADADGVGAMTTAIWRPTTGAPEAFGVMPTLAPGATTQVRFLIPLEPGHAGVSTVSFHQRDGGTALFDVSGEPGFAVAAAPVPAPSGAGVALTAFEVTVDAVTGGVGARTELIFTARNRTNAIQYLGGTRLRFQTRAAGGGVVESLGQTWFIRGRRDRPVDMIVVPPGRAVRLRVVFDVPGVSGPITVSDGQASATLPAPSAPEPVW